MGLSEDPSTSNDFDTNFTADTVSDTNDSDISFGDITSSEYARKGRELMKLANDLRAMGYAVFSLCWSFELNVVTTVPQA